MSNASRKTSIPSKIYSKVKYRCTTFFSSIRQTNSQNFPPESRTTTDVRKFNLESLTIFKGCLKIFNFPAKKLRKNTVPKNTHAPDFFFFSRIIIHLSINFYFYCLVVLYLFIIDKNKVFSICVIFIVFHNIHSTMYKCFISSKFNYLKRCQGKFFIYIYTKTFGGKI